MGDKTAISAKAKVLLGYCFAKKTFTESRCLPLDDYGDDGLSKTQPACFKFFKSGDFDIMDKDRSGHEKNIEDEELTHSKRKLNSQKH